MKLYLCSKYIHHNILKKQRKLKISKKKKHIMDTYRNNLIEWFKLFS